MCYKLSTSDKTYSDLISNWFRTVQRTHKLDSKTNELHVYWADLQLLHWTAYDGHQQRGGLGCMLQR